MSKTTSKDKITSSFVSGLYLKNYRFLLTRCFFDKGEPGVFQERGGRKKQYTAIINIICKISLNSEYVHWFLFFKPQRSAFREKIN